MFSSDYLHSSANKTNKQSNKQTRVSYNSQVHTSHTKVPCLIFLMSVRTVQRLNYEGQELKKKEKKVVYKIGSACIANCLKVVLPTLINEDQTVFMANRFI